MLAGWLGVGGAPLDEGGAVVGAEDELGFGAGEAAFEGRDGHVAGLGGFFEREAFEAVQQERDALFGVGGGRGCRRPL